MTAIEDIVNSLVRGAKNNCSDVDIRFVKAYKTREAEKPVSGFAAVVEIGEATAGGSFVGGYFNTGVKGDIYKVALTVSIYSPDTISGEDLSTTALKVSEAFKKADESGIIEEMSVSPIAFDENTSAIYRSIDMRLGFCLCGEK